MELLPQPSPRANVWLLDTAAAKVQFNNSKYKSQADLAAATQNDKYGSSSESTTSRFLNGQSISYKKARILCKYLWPNWAEKHWYKWLATERPAQGNPDSGANLKPKGISGNFNSDKIDESTKQRYRFTADKTRNFVGRRYVFEAFEIFRSTRSSGYFALIGDPGEGKTAIAAKYVEDNRQNPYCLSFFAGRRTERRNPVQFLQEISSQLMELLGLRPEDIGLLKISTDGHYLKAVLDAASRRAKAIGQELIIVVDALDEIDIEANPEASNVLGLPSTLPSDVYFFLTFRRDSRLENKLQFDSIKVFDFLRFSEETEIGKRITEDIREYIRRHLDDPKSFELGEGIRPWLKSQRIKDDVFIEKLLEKSQRNFLYLKFILPQFTEGGLYESLDDFQLLPIGLTNYYQDHWHRMKKICTHEIWEIAIHILCVFTVAYAWIPSKRIADIATEVSQRNISAYKVSELFEGWKQFIHERQRLEEAYEYQLYHESYNDFASDYALKAAGLSRKEVSRLYTNSMVKGYDFDEGDDIDD
jgi:hypothetical protein